MLPPISPATPAFVVALEPTKLLTVDGAREHSLELEHMHTNVNHTAVQFPMVYPVNYFEQTNRQLSHDLPLPALPRLSFGSSGLAHPEISLRVPVQALLVGASHYFSPVQTAGPGMV
jgi:hypothetical protein